MVQSHHTMGDGTSHHVCPLMGTTPGCVNIMEHLSHWQSSFVAVLSDIVPLLVLLFIACVGLSFLQRFKWSLFGSLVQPLFIPVRERTLLPRSLLQQAFSDGLIHSKAY